MQLSAINTFHPNIIIGQMGWSAPPIPLDGYSDLPPPTYNQAISADEGDQIFSNTLNLYIKILFLHFPLNVIRYSSFPNHFT